MEAEDRSLFGQIVKKLGSDWLKVAMYLGVSVTSLEVGADPSSMTPDELKSRAFSQWREQQRDRPDRGMAELLLALQKAGHGRIVQHALDHLEAQ